MRATRSSIHDACHARRLQYSTRQPQDSLKTASRSLQNGEEGGREDRPSLRPPLKRPRWLNMPQYGSKMVQDSSKTAPRQPQDSTSQHKTAPHSTAPHSIRRTSTRDTHHAVHLQHRISELLRECVPRLFLKRVAELSRSGHFKFGAEMFSCDLSNSDFAFGPR